MATPSDPNNNPPVSPLKGNLEGTGKIAGQKVLTPARKSSQPADPAAQPLSAQGSTTPVAPVPTPTAPVGTPTGSTVVIPPAPPLSPAPIPIATQAPPPPTSATPAAATQIQPQKTPMKFSEVERVRKACDELIGKVKELVEERTKNATPLILDDKDKKILMDDREILSKYLRQLDKGRRHHFYLQELNAEQQREVQKIEQQLTDFNQSIDAWVKSSGRTPFPKYSRAPVLTSGAAPAASPAIKTEPLDKRIANTQSMLAALIIKNNALVPQSEIQTVAQKRQAYAQLKQRDPASLNDNEKAEFHQLERGLTAWIENWQRWAAENKGWVEDSNPQKGLPKSEPPLYGVTAPPPTPIAARLGNAASAISAQAVVPDAAAVGVRARPTGTPTPITPQAKAHAAAHARLAPIASTGEPLTREAFIKQNVELENRLKASYPRDKVAVDLHESGHPLRVEVANGSKKDVIIRSYSEMDNKPKLQISNPPSDNALKVMFNHVAEGITPLTLQQQTGDPKIIRKLFEIAVMSGKEVKFQPGDEAMLKQDPEYPLLLAIKNNNALCQELANIPNRELGSKLPDNFVQKIRAEQKQVLELSGTPEEPPPKPRRNTI